MTQKATLPNLPYDFNALEPFISAEIMEIHYTKHHNGYVTNLNKALDLQKTAEEKGDLSASLALQSAINFNGGGHLNHSIFWTNLAPKKAGGGTPPKGPLAQAINTQFGSLEKFIEKFNAKTAPIQGSGWGWLGFNPETQKLQIAACNNQDPLIKQGLIPLLGIDVWEHAYYLQYKNLRPNYLKAIWEVINWSNVAERFEACLQN